MQQPTKFTCQTCSKVFTSLKGMRIHQGKTLHNKESMSTLVLIPEVKIDHEMMKIEIERERLEVEKLRIKEEREQKEMELKQQREQMKEAREQKEMELKQERLKMKVEREQFELELKRKQEQKELELEHDAKEREQDRALDKYKFDMDQKNKKEALDKKLQAYIGVEHERNETMKEINNKPRVLLVGPRTETDIYQPRIYGTIGRPYYDYNDMNRMIESCPLEGQRTSFKSMMRTVKEVVEVNSIGEIEVVSKDAVDYVSHTCSNVIKEEIGEATFQQQYQTKYNDLVPHVAKKEPIKNVVASFEKLLEAAGIDAADDPLIDKEDQLAKLKDFKQQCETIIDKELDTDFTFNFIVRNDIVTCRLEENGLVLTDASYRFNADQKLLVEKGNRITTPDKQTIWEKDYGRVNNIGHCKGCNKMVHRDDCEKCHVIPKSKGGSNHVHNLVMQCRDCNQNMKDTELTLYNIGITV